MPEAPLELAAAAPAADAAWLACLAPLTSRSLLAFAYEGTLAPAAGGPMGEPTQKAFLKLLGVAGARVVVLTQRDAADLHAVFSGLSPLVPAFLVGAHETTPAPSTTEALDALATDHDFDHVLYVGSNEAALGHQYAVPSTRIWVGPAAPAGTRATYWIREQDAAIAVCSRVFDVLVELAPAQSVARPS